jgi:hypothetical protein
MGAATAQKSDHPAESAVPSSRCRGSRSYGHHDGRHCCGGGFDDGLGHGHCYARDHDFARHLGPCRDYRVLVVHGHHCILLPCYAFGSGLRSGRAAGRQVVTEDEHQRAENVSLWARGPYVKDERKPLVVVRSIDSLKVNARRSSTCVVLFTRSGINLDLAGIYS